MCFVDAATGCVSLHNLLLTSCNSGVRRVYNCGRCARPHPPKPNAGLGAPCPSSSAARAALDGFAFCRSPLAIWNKLLQQSSTALILTAPMF